MRLKDKVIAITGSGSGLGRECALLFAEHGAKVVTSDVVPGRAQAVAKEVEAAGGDAVGLDADVRSEEQVASIVSTAIDSFGRLDGMHANAGIPEPGFGVNKLEDLSLDAWNDIVSVNMTGIFLAFKHAALHMIERGGGGTLLATTSAAAFAAYPGFPAYGASKAGANGFVRAASFEWGKHGIRVNALCPTHGMSANFALPPDAEILGKSYEEMAPWDPEVRAMPLRLDRPPAIRDNANLALFLMSDESIYMHGQCIQSCDGGTFARAAIIFPQDLGNDSLSVLPEELQQQMKG